MHKRQILPALATVALLGGLWTDKLLLHRAPADATAHHHAVANAAAAIPVSIGPWLGQDVAVPQAAIAILHPNVIVARRYEEFGTGLGIQFLLVHCRDARDILGHYPPVCYVGQGWVLQSATPFDVEIDNLAIHATRYTFKSDRPDRPPGLVVDNFMVLPNGTTCRNMEEVTEAARDRTYKYFGAGQIQILYDERVPENRRAEIFSLFVSANRPVIETMRSGTKHEQ